MKKTLLLLPWLLFIVFTAFSQTRQIKGKITDESGTPLAGVNVVAQGVRTGTQTDASVNFTLNVSGNRSAC